jgi:hypothetical protein
MVEHLAVNEVVPGSSPGFGAVLRALHAKSGCPERIHRDERQNKQDSSASRMRPNGVNRASRIRSNPGFGASSIPTVRAWLNPISAFRRLLVSSRERGVGVRVRKARRGMVDRLRHLGPARRSPPGRACTRRFRRRRWRVAFRRTTKHRRGRFRGLTDPDSSRRRGCGRSRRRHR